MGQGESQRTRYFSERHGLRGPQSEVVGSDFWEGFARVVSRMAERGMLSERFGAARNSANSGATLPKETAEHLRFSTNRGTPPGAL